MISIPIPPDKRALIVGGGLDSLKALFKELPLSDQSQMLKILPAADGFKPGSPRARDKQLELFFANLKRTRGSVTEAAWDTYGVLLQRWLDAHPDLRAALPDMRSLADITEDSDATERLTTLGMLCFVRLLDANRADKVSREEIDLFYHYGYFLPDPHIDALIALTRTKAEIEEAIRLRALPATVAALQETFGDLVGRLETNTSLTQNVERSMEQSVSRLASEVSGLRAMIETAAPQATPAAVEERLEAVEDALSELRDLRNREDATTAATVSADQFSALVQRFEALETLVKARENSIADKPSDADGPVPTLKDALADISSASAPASEPSPSVAGRPSLRPISCCPMGEVETWKTTDDALVALCSNLRSIGMTEASSKILVGDLVAGWRAAQMVMFRGSFGGLVAHVCAQSVAASQHSLLRIPVGLLSSDDLDHALAAATHRHQDMAVLVIEGLNRSAFEAYGPALEALLTERTLLHDRPADNLLLLGTLVEGPSTLPVSAALCELGPILDVDCYNWATTWTPHAVRSGVLPQGIWHFDTPRSEAGPSETVLELVRALGYRSARWRRTVAAAYHYLALAESEAEVTPGPLRSVAFGWILPYAASRGLSGARLQALFEEHGLLDSGDNGKDKRLNYALASLTAVT